MTRPAVAEWVELHATCSVCGSAMQLVRPGKWQCDTCDAARWTGVTVYDDDAPGED